MTDATAAISGGIITRVAGCVRVRQEFTTGPLREGREDLQSVVVRDSSWINEVLREENKMPKDKEQVERFIETLESEGFEPRSYSGRGMYGKECVSVSGDDVSVWNVARALWYDRDGDQQLNVPEPRQDQLGLGIVLYWPSFEWPKESV